MQKIAVPPVRLLLFLLSGTVIVLVGAYIGLLALWVPSPLEAFAPAKETVVLFRHVTKDDLVLFRDRFPLPSPTDIEGVVDVAVVDAGEGSVGWVMAGDTLPKTNMLIGRQRFLHSESPDVSELFQSATSLKRDATFRSLIARSDGSRASIYIRDPDLARFLPPSAARVAGNLAEKPTALLMARSASGVTVSIAGAVKMMINDAPWSPRLSPAPEATVTIGNFSESMPQLLGLVSPEERVMLPGMLNKQTQRMLGDDWSFAYDVAPLLADSATVAWKNTPSGTLFLLRGRSSDATRTREELSKFHARFRGRLAGALIEKHDFPDKLSSTLLKGDPSQVEDKAYEQGGWTVRETRDKGGKAVLASATRGNECILTNTPEWLESALKGRAVAPRMPQSSVFSGTLSGTMTRSAFGSMRATPEWLWLTQTVEGGKLPQNGLSFALESHGQVITLSFTLLAAL